MQYTSTVKLPFVIAIGFLAVAQMHADIFYTTANQTGGNSPNWNSAIWTNTANPVASAPTAGNDYVLASATTLRSPYSSNPQPFNGDSLQLNTGGNLRLKAVSQPGPSSYSFGSGGLILNGGFIGNGDDQIATITSKITVLSSSAIYAGQDATTDTGNNVQGGFRAFILSGGLAGSGNLTFGNAIMAPNIRSGAGPNGNTTFANTADFSFTGNGSLYSGNILLTSGWLQAASANAFGSANITLAGTPFVDNTHSATGPAKFDATIAFSSAGTLTVNDANSILLLASDLTFAGATIDGQVFGIGDYSASDINTATTFGNVSGAGILHIVAVPEPSIMALAALGGLGVFALRRKRA